MLLAERGLKPEFKPLLDYNFTNPQDNLMLIGDPALDFLFGKHNHEIFDLGAAWFEMTKLPFVFAVWALRRGIENKELRRQLREAKDACNACLDSRDFEDLDLVTCGGSSSKRAANSPTLPEGPEGEGGRTQPSFRRLRKLACVAKQPAAGWGIRGEHNRSISSAEPHLVSLRETTLPSGQGLRTAAGPAESEEMPDDNQEI